MTITTLKIRQTLSIETRPTAAPGILAYRCRLEDDHVETRVWEGLCDEDHLPSRTEFRPKLRQRWEVHFKRDIESVAARGWQNGTPLRESSATPFRDLNPALGEWTHQLVRLDLDANMLFDVDGLPLVVAQDIDAHLWRTTSEDGRYDREFFDFRWVPDLATYRRAWARCLETDCKFPSTMFARAVYDLDLLGLRAAGCMR
jgi:hypothetical protein